MGYVHDLILTMEQSMYICVLSFGQIVLLKCNQQYIKTAKYVHYFGATQMMVLNRIIGALGTPSI